MRFHHPDSVHYRRPFHIYPHKLAPFVLMRGLFVAILLVLFIPSVGMAQEASPVIVSPIDGQILRGQVPITGTTDIPNFASAELDFTYASVTAGNWFLIQALSRPVVNSALATWDTSSVSDGDYVLRLRVALQDGTFHDATIKVKIMNEAAAANAVPTATSAPAFNPQSSVKVSALASPTPTTSPFATPTDLPSNPVEVQSQEIYHVVQRGALMIVGLFVVFGVLIRLRRS